MEDISIYEYMGMLGRRKGTIAAVTVLALVIGTIVILVTPHTYRGRASILFPQKQASSAVGMLSQLAELPGLSSAIPKMSSPAMYSEILKSRTLAEQVIRDVNLDRAQVDPEVLMDQIEIDTSKDGTLKISCYAPETWVSGAGGDKDQQTSVLAADIANAYIRQLEIFDRSHTLTSGRHNTVFLEGEVVRTRGQLSKSEESLRSFVAAHPTLAPPGAATEEFKQIISLRSSQIQAETELREAERAADEAKSMANDQQAVESLAKVIQENPVIITLRGKMAQDEVTRARLLENFTEQHPDVVEIDQQITKTRDQISREAAKVTSSETVGPNPVRQAIVQNLAEIEVKRSGLEARLKALNGVMSSMERQVSSRAGDQMIYVRLLRDVKALEMVYTSLLTELNQAKVSESKDPESFTVLDTAIPEKKRSKPKKTMTLLAAMILGLWAGSFLAIVQETKRIRKRLPMRSAEPPVPAARE